MDTLREMVRKSRLSAGLLVFAVLVVACTASTSTDTTVPVSEASDGEAGEEPSASADPAPAPASRSSAQPSYGSGVIDGDSSEWDLGQDFFANMYRAGKPDKDVLSKLYVRYACDTETLYVLVLTEPGWEIIPSDSDNFVKLGNSTKLVDGASGNDGTPPDFEYVGTTGWEAAAGLAPGSHENLNVHAEVTEAGTRGSGETSAVDGRGIPIEIVCDTSSTTTSTVSPTSTLPGSTTSTSLSSTTTTLVASTTTSPSTTSTTVSSTTTTLVASTTTSPLTTSTTIPLSTTSVVDSSTTLGPGESTTSSENVGGSSIVATTLDIGSETLPNTGPEEPFGSTALVVWFGVLALSVGGLLVRIVRDRP